MLDKPSLRVALLRGALTAAAFAVAWPAAMRGMFSDTGPLHLLALHGAFLGLLASPCAALEAIGRRRQGGWILGMAAAAWLVAGVAELWYGPALVYLRAGGGGEGLDAAAMYVSKAGLAWRTTWAVITGTLLGALTLVRAAGAGVVAQVAFTHGVYSFAMTLGYWGDPWNQLFDTYGHVHRTCLLFAAPFAGLAVGAAALADRLAWRSAPVPPYRLEQARAWIVLAAVLLLGPRAYAMRSAEAERRDRVALARRMAASGDRTSVSLAVLALIDDDPDLARQVLLERGERGDSLLAEYVYQFFGREYRLRPLLDHARPETRLVAVQALGRLAVPAVIADLARALWDEDASVRDASLDALLDPKLEAYRARDRREFLLAVAASHEVRVAARALLTHPSLKVRGRALALVERGFDEQSWQEREAAQHVLRGLLPDETDAALRARLEDLLR